MEIEIPILRYYQKLNWKLEKSKYLLGNKLASIPICYLRKKYRRSIDINLALSAKHRYKTKTVNFALEAKFKIEIKIVSFKKVTIHIHR